MARRTHRGGFERRTRVGEEIRHALAGIFVRGDIHDPVLRNISITVGEVEVSPDLRNATAYVLPFGDADPDEMLEGLARVTPFLRHQLSQRVHLRYVPMLRFALDQTFEQASKIESLLQRPEVARDLSDTEVSDQTEDDEPPTTR